MTPPRAALPTAQPSGGTLCRSSGLGAHALGRPFCALSQGEQKLILVGAAIAKRPALLVLDEPCQGLDPLSRRRLLSLMDHVCAHSDATLVYITHHYEEVMPCISHVLHLSGGGVAFCGERHAYEQSGLPRLTARHHVTTM